MDAGVVALGGGGGWAEVVAHALVSSFVSPNTLYLPPPNANSLHLAATPPWFLTGSFIFVVFVFCFGFLCGICVGPCCDLCLLVRGLWSRFVEGLRFSAPPPAAQPPLARRPLYLPLPPARAPRLHGE